MKSKTCLFCKVRFQTNTSQKRYCSVKCSRTDTYQKNRDEYVAYAKNRYHTNPEVRKRSLSYSRARYRADPKKHQDAYKEYLTRPGKLEATRQTQQRYRNENREKIRVKNKHFQKLYRTLYPWRSCLSNAKKAVQSKKLKMIPYDLTDEWAKKRWTGNCELTGTPFVIGKHAGSKLFWPSIDRINPALGYVQANCRFILLSVNSFKMDGTDADMLKIARTIVAAFPQ